MEYNELKQKQQKEFNEFPMMFAFNANQFRKGMERLGITDAKAELLDIGGGGFIRKTDSDALDELITRHEKEMAIAMMDKRFLIDAIEYELGNYEYCITHDPTETIRTLSLDLDNPVHAECFIIARRQYLTHATA